MTYSTYEGPFTQHGYSGYEPHMSKRDHAIEGLMDDYDLSYPDAVDRYEALLEEYWDYRGEE